MILFIGNFSIFSLPRLFYADVGNELYISRRGKHEAQPSLNKIEELKI